MKNLDMLAAACKPAETPAPEPQQTQITDDLVNKVADAIIARLSTQLDKPDPEPAPPQDPQSPPDPAPAADPEGGEVDNG